MLDISQNPQEPTKTSPEHEKGYDFKSYFIIKLKIFSFPQKIKKTWKETRKYDPFTEKLVETIYEESSHRS